MISPSVLCERHAVALCLTAGGTEDQENDKGGKLTDRNCGCCRSCCCCFIPWLRIQNFLHGIVTDPLFDLFITSCIVLNTVFLAIEHYGMSSTLKLVLAVGNYVSGCCCHCGSFSQLNTLGFFFFFFFHIVPNFNMMKALMQQVYPLHFAAVWVTVVLGQMHSIR